jgi:hypothetical protein
MDGSEAKSRGLPKRIDSGVALPFDLQHPMFHFKNRKPKSLEMKNPQIYDLREVFADRTGLEPATSAVTGRHSNQLNYRSN